MIKPTKVGEAEHSALFASVSQAHLNRIAHLGQNAREVLAQPAAQDCLKPQDGRLEVQRGLGLFAQPNGHM
jgi:hypothetical protein